MNVLEQRKADQALLDCVLGYALSEFESKPFESMRSDLADGTQLTLSSVQREWVRKVLKRHEPEYENLISTGRVPLTPTKRYAFETMPKPLRPPRKAETEEP